MTWSASPICSARESICPEVSQTSPTARMTTVPGCGPSTTSVTSVSSGPSSRMAAAPVRIFVADAGCRASPAACSHTVSPVTVSVTRPWTVPSAGFPASAVSRAPRAALSTVSAVAGSSSGDGSSATYAGAWVRSP